MSYLGRKVAFYLVALWAAITLNFALPRMMPGNPVELIMARFKGRVNPAAIHAFTLALGLQQHKPLIAQYFQYLDQLIHGNLGISIVYFPEPVIKVILQALPWTLFLVGFATVISFILGTLLGIIASWRRRSFFDLIVPTAFTFTATLPYFWLALVLLYILAFHLGMFPLGHAYSGSDNSWAPSNWGDIIYHTTLPALTIVITSIGGWLLGMRNNMINIMGQDFVTIARAKGLKEWRIVLKYAARNAILPNITGFGMSLGFLVSGAVLTEVVFSYPGLGYTLYQAVGAEDYPLMQGTLLFIAIAVLLANFLVDLLYVRLDPRSRKEGG
jgi:peptide/nickel transport system permease protein